MKPFAVLSLLFALAGCGKKSPDGPPPIPPPPEVTQADSQTAADGDIAFALDLNRKIAVKGSLVFSPASISTALAMTYAGAAGNTAAEMKAALHFKLDDDTLDAVNHKRLYVWNGSDGVPRPYDLRVANSLWAQQDEGWNDKFLKRLETRYASAFHRVDFANQSGAVRGMVNEWAKQSTLGKIPEVLPNDLPTPDTRLILANAVYFKGKWAKPFDKDNTRDADFHCGDKVTIQVPTMHKTAVFGYSDSGKLKVLQIPFEGQSFSLVVLLPARNDGLAGLEQSLAPKEWSGLIQDTRRTVVHVFLPKFKIESDLILNAPLISLGMKSAFDRDQADFSGMNGKRNLFISHVLQKAMIEVSEEGSEAAAATTVVGIAKSEAPRKDPPPVPVFRADYPFLFAIRDDRTGDLLFMGRMVGK